MIIKQQHWFMIEVTVDCADELLLDLLAVLEHVRHRVKPDLREFHTREAVSELHYRVDRDLFVVFADAYELAAYRVDVLRVFQVLHVLQHPGPGARRSHKRLCELCGVPSWLSSVSISARGSGI